MQVRITGLTDKGKVRAENQDTFVNGFLSPDTLYAAVFDGMGGANAGKFASALAAGIFEKALNAAGAARAESDGEALISTLLTRINRVMYERACSQYEYSGMGTTCVAALLTDGVGYVANIGDSRAYIIDSESCTQLTKDHSMVAALVESGEISDDEAREHPQRNIITRALGTDREVVPDIFPADIRGKRLLICSDGLHNYFTPEELAQTVNTAGDDGIACKALMTLACERGGRDNITLIIINCT